MGNNSPVLFVAVVGEIAWVKITGRATFSSSVSFKTLVNELRHRKFARFILDLTECQTMDSTFLGVLAGLALRLGEGNHKRDSSLSLRNPNARVLELLENLGVAHLFMVCQVQNPATPEAKPVASSPVSREELSRTCLEAHQVLMNVNPDNIPKFKEVTQFLAEDLKNASATPTAAGDPGL